MGKKIYKPIEKGDRFGSMEVTGEVGYRFDNNRKRKYYEVWCNHCHSYKFVRDDMIRHQKTCGCLSKNYRARYLHLKSKNI